MKKTMKRLLSVLLSLMLVLGALPMTVFAAGGTTGDVSWSISGDTLSITGTGEMANYSASNSPDWEEYSESIKKITVASGVTKIGNYAFFGLDKVTSVTLNEGLKNIGTYVFNYCSELTELEIPSTVESIGNAAFGNSGIKKITFKGDSLIAAGTNTFKTVSNAKIIVPEGFTIGGTAATAAKTGAAPFYNNYVGFAGSATVYWQNGDGTVLKVDTNVTAGTVPAYVGTTPTKAATETATYTFKGWDVAPAAVSENEIYIYTATFDEEAITPAATYTVTWMDAWGENLLGTDSVLEGTSPVYSGETPTHPEDDYDTYSFYGWRDEDWNRYAADALPAVTGDVTYYATFNSTPKYYDITWKNWDGNVLETDEDVEAGTWPSYDGETPTREEDATYRYAFRGWTPSVEGVHANTVYTADYTRIRKNAPYIDENGTANTVDAIVLDGSESMAYYDYSSVLFLGEDNTTSWYIVEDAVSYADPNNLNTNIRIKGDVRLILADGASLNVKDEIKTPYTDAARSLSIYGQSAGTGSLTTGSFTRYYQFDALNIYGGKVNANQIDRVKEVTVVSGNLNISGQIHSWGAITLGCADADDSITAGSYEGESVSIAAGQTLTDGTDTYTGSIANASVLNGKTLTLYQTEPSAKDKYNLTLTDNIDVNMLIDVAGHTANGEAIEKIEYTYPDINSQTRTILTETVTDVTADADGYYAKSFTMAIAQVNEPITATVYFTNGTHKPIDVSVAGYCESVINMQNGDALYNYFASTIGEEKIADLKTLCYSILDYGKNAADYFEYAYDEYPSYTLPPYFDAEPEITSQAGIKKGSVVTGIASTQMFILSKATMRLTFKDDLSNVEVVSAKVTKANGEEVSLNAEITESNGQYSVDISGISATELCKPIILELSDGTKVQYAATDWAKSILTYSTNAKSKELAKSLYYYSKAANDYFA